MLGQVVGKELERHAAAKVHVFGDPHRSHATGADAFRDSIVRNVADEGPFSLADTGPAACSLKDRPRNLYSCAFLYRSTSPVSMRVRDAGARRGGSCGVSLFLEKRPSSRRLAASG